MLKIMIASIIARLHLRTISELLLGTDPEMVLSLFTVCTGNCSTKNCDMSYMSVRVHAIGTVPC